MESYINKNIQEAVEWCAFKRVPFVVFKSIGEEKVSFYCAPSVLDNPSQKPDNGFFIGEFVQKSQDFLWIPFELDVHQTLKNRMRLPNNSTTPDLPFPADTSREDYLKEVEELVKTLGEREVAKTVISRVKTEYLFNYNLKSILDNLFYQGPDSFTYCFYHPQAGFWMGSSPEVVYSSEMEPNVFCTMALAGTKESGEQWDEKNIEEQALVIHDIMSRLEENKIGAALLKSFDKSFGNLQHRCSLIYGKTEQMAPLEIVDILNPTAAISGYPRSEALNDIRRIEKHDRKYYGGVVGYRFKDRVEAYANIRCVNFSKSRYTFYAGGGILSESNPINEWEETCRKIDSLKDKMGVL